MKKTVITNVLKSLVIGASVSSTVLLTGCGDDKTDKQAISSYAEQAESITADSNVVEQEISVVEEPAVVETIYIVQDDERIEDIGRLLGQKKAGEHIDPVEISMGTYLDLDQKVRGQLEEVLRIRFDEQTVAQIKGGYLMAPVYVAYSDLYSWMMSAAENRDNQAVKLLVKNVKPRPFTNVQEVFEHLNKAYVSLDRDAFKFLDKYTGVASALYRDEDKSYLSQFSSDEYVSGAPVLSIELMYRLGARLDSSLSFEDRTVYETVIDDSAGDTTVLVFSDQTMRMIEDEKSASSSNLMKSSSAGRRVFSDSQWRALNRGAGFQSESSDYYQTLHAKLGVNVKSLPIEAVSQIMSGQDVTLFERSGS